MQQIQKPVVGDMIHVVGNDGTHWPAIVQVVHDTPGVIDAWAFLRHSSGPERRLSYGEPMTTAMDGETLKVSPAEPHTWHWIEVEPDATAEAEAQPVFDNIQETHG